MTDKRRKLAHTSVQQVEFLCAFLEENPKARACLVGETGGKNAPVLSGVPFTDKQHVYREMAKRVGELVFCLKKTNYTLSGQYYSKIQKTS
jgi:hypothetical protein